MVDKQQGSEQFYVATFDDDGQTVTVDIEADPALPHTDFSKRNKGYVKPPKPSYFINSVSLCQSGGLMPNG